MNMLCFLSRKEDEKEGLNLSIEDEAMYAGTSNFQSLNGLTITVLRRTKNKIK